jgi:uncharacterized coiled-coil protein SlyX
MFINKDEAIELTSLPELIRLEKLFTERAKSAQSMAAKLRRVIKKLKKIEKNTTTTKEHG